MDLVRAEMALLALADPSNLAPQVGALATDPSDRFSTDLPNIDLQNPGLTRAQLEDVRWNVSAPVAEAAFKRIGLTLEGRAAGRIYAWPLILEIEGVPAELARRGSPDTHPQLFEDLIDTKAAARLLKMSEPHVRKVAEAGCLKGCDIIRFGARGMFRFRRAQILAEAQRRVLSRLVMG
ncbi:MAG: hypothetical protein KGN33_18965, partial [Paracoccaceae bacterium]|nr:hypothetical protein [Paracoccaceae bacterium]